MTQVNSIRDMLFEKGMNYAQIARATSRDVKQLRNTYLKDDFNQPGLKVRNKRCSKLDHYKATIDKWLEADKPEKKLQCHTAQTVFNRLKKTHGADFEAFMNMQRDDRLGGIESLGKLQMISW